MNKVKNIVFYGAVIGGLTGFYVLCSKLDRPIEYVPKSEITFDNGSIGFDCYTEDPGSRVFNPYEQVIVKSIEFPYRIVNYDMDSSINIDCPSGYEVLDINRDFNRRDEFTVYFTNNSTVEVNSHYNDLLNYYDYSDFGVVYTDDDEKVYTK